MNEVPPAAEDGGLDKPPEEEAGLDSIHELPPEGPALAPVPELVVIKKGPLPSKAQLKGRKPGGTIRRLAAAGSKLTPAAKRKLLVFLVTSVTLGLGTLGGFLVWAKPWIPNDPPPVRAANEVGAEGLRGRALKWATEQELVHARRFIDASLDPKSAKQALDEGAAEKAVERSRAAVKEHGLPKATTLFGQIGLTEKLVINVEESSRPATEWLGLLAASNLVADLEAHDHLEERYLRNNGPMIEDRIVGLAARKRANSGHPDAAESDMGKLAVVLEFRGAWNLYLTQASGIRYSADSLQRMIEEARRTDAFTK